MVASQFKRIGILGRVKNPGVAETLKALVCYLQSLKQSIVIEAETVLALHDSNLPTISKEKLSQECDLLIVVGGDGSLLHASHTVINKEIPILGVNRGRLGFLTDVHPTELNKIKNILEGKYILEKRFMLTANVILQGKMLGQNDALNEVALIPDLIPHMCEFEIYIDDQFVCSQDSDGMIVATPTGSTAYALSGGGPILHPQLDAMVIVPMFPHTLSFRPIVIEGNRRISIIITPDNTTSPRLTCDGQAVVQVPPGGQINICKKKERLQLIHPIDYDYYGTLRSKLHWGHKLYYPESE